LRSIANISARDVYTRRRKPALGFNLVRVIPAVFCLNAICSAQSPPTFVMDGQVDLPRIRKDRVKPIFFSLFTSDSYHPNRLELKQTMILMDLALRQIRKNQDHIETARNASDIGRIHESVKIVAFSHLEGSFDLDGDLGVPRDL